MQTKVNFTLILVLIVIATLAWQINTAQGQGAVEKGLVGYWSFDKATIKAKTVKDGFGKNDGKIEGSPKVVEGKVGEALEFNGEDESVIVEDPKNGSLDFGDKDSFTLEAWAKPLRGTKKSMRIMDKKDGNDIGYVLEYNSVNGYNVYANDGANPAAQVPIKKKQLDEWHHVVGVYDKANRMIDLFVDGVAVGAKKIRDTEKGLSNDVPLYIARRESGEWFKVTIDEVRIYNRVLTEAEIKRNFGAGGLAVEAARKLAITWGRLKTSR